MIVERFAPSPTGLLHLGHAFSALTAYDAARVAQGDFILRIEDIDGPRVSTEHEEQIFEDLRWLGLAWKQPVMRQSQRMTVYRTALEKLSQAGLVFPCSCNRGDIKRALSAPQEGDAPVNPYPGTCRARTMDSFQPGDAVRLNMSKALQQIEALRFTEIGHGGILDVTPSHAQMIEEIGDVVLARKDIQTSYHLSVVVDDAEQSVTHVTRGEDMYNLTPLHVLLQKLLYLPTPVYRHHKLVRDKNNKRLAKRHDALSLKLLRQQGWSPEDIRAHLGIQQNR